MEGGCSKRFDIETLDLKPSSYRGPITLDPSTLLDRQEYLAGESNQNPHLVQLISVSNPEY